MALGPRSQWVGKPRAQSKLFEAVVCGGGIKSPLRIPGLALWYDASDISTIAVDGSNRIATWANKSGVANCDATQGASASKPTYEATGLIGRPAIHFTKTASQYFELGAGTYPLLNARSAMTVVAVMQRLSSTGSTQTLITLSVGTSATLSRLSVHTVADTTRQITGRRVDTDTSAAASFGFGDTSVHIVTRIGDYAAGTARAYSDGVYLGEQAFTSAGLVSATDSLRARIGASLATTPASFMDGYVSEIDGWSRLLTPTELTLVQRYLSRKWGVPLLG